MIQQLYRFESARAKHRDAPMLPEREEYLSYLFQQGVGRSRLRSIALTLLKIVFYLDLKETRAVTRAELQQGSERWLAASIEGAAKIPSPALLRQFAFTARRWLRFQNQLCLETSSASSTENIVNEFTHYLTVVRGLAPETVRIYGSRASVFLIWSALRCTPVSDISLSDVDDFISMKKDSGYLPRSIVAFCGAIRMFFRYAESRGWNDSHITRNLRGPRIPRYGAAPKGPKWADVRRLLNNRTQTMVELRAVAILCLCSVYGLRSSEVVNLKLSDFDWVSETFVVHRVKRGRLQQFPIQFEVGEAILRYLQFGRPHCPCRSLFVSLRAPYRSVRATTLWGIAADRMKRLGISSENYGGHSLRHACATELLRKGSSLKDIADFLGHRDMRSVCIYAKYDMKSLRRVASMSLAGVK